MMEDYAGKLTSTSLMRTPMVAWELPLKPVIGRPNRRRCSGMLRAGSSGTDPKLLSPRYP